MIFKIMTSKDRFEIRIIRFLRVLCQNLATWEAGPRLSYLLSPYLALCHLRTSVAFAQTARPIVPRPIHMLPLTQPPLRPRSRHITSEVQLQGQIQPRKVY